MRRRETTVLAVALLLDALPSLLALTVAVAVIEPLALNGTATMIVAVRVAPDDVLPGHVQTTGFPVQLPPALALADTSVVGVGIGKLI